MAEHIDRNIARNNHGNINLDSRATATSLSPNVRPFDDVIASLANARENRRARQVSEWESLRKRLLHSAS